MKCDLNCDLGEAESSAVRRALMRHITSANIACGGHAGDARSMRETVRAAKSFDVRIGAHPGLASRGDFGRTAVNISVREFETLLLQQIGALETIVRAEGARLHHVKLHGALYHLSEADAHLRRAFLSTMRRYWPKVLIFARAGGKVVSAAPAFGLRAWPEGFLDRGYRRDGSLVPRAEPGAILNRSQFADRLCEIRERRTALRFPVKTWCVHSDTPKAVEFARLAKAALM